MNPKKTREENIILEQLEQGKWIRLQDGRCGDGFVDMAALQHLLETEQVEQFDNQGVPFVRALKKVPLAKACMGRGGRIIATCPYCDQMHEHNPPIGNGRRKADCLKGEYIFDFNEEK